MYRINENYLKLPGSYLFSTIAKKVAAFSEKETRQRVIRMGIGDVTQPLCPAVIQALHKAVDEMGAAETFHGYGPENGYAFLRERMAEVDYAALGANIAADEIFISDGAKSDSGNIQEIFSLDSTVAVCDPVYPVYYDTAKGVYAGITYLPCTAENEFTPEFPAGKAPDLIYLCSPNNPTGAVMRKEALQRWVDYANENGSVILFDAAYEAYITEPDIPHTIYECEGARTCAIELRSFSKKAGFTGLRLGATVVPHDLRKRVKRADGTTEEVELHALWSRRHGTKFNGAPYIVQRAGEAVYSEAGQRETAEQVAYYMRNAHAMYKALKEAGFAVYGGVNAPYVWVKTPEAMTSWEFFDTLLEKAAVVGTPGSGFGPHGEHYFRFSAFGSREDTEEAMARIRALKF